MGCCAVGGRGDGCAAATSLLSTVLDTNSYLTTLSHARLAPSALPTCYPTCPLVDFAHIQGRPVDFLVCAFFFYLYVVYEFSGLEPLDVLAFFFHPFPLMKNTLSVAPSPFPPCSSLTCAGPPPSLPPIRYECSFLRGKDVGVRATYLPTYLPTYLLACL